MLEQKQCRFLGKMHEKEGEDAGAYAVVLNPGQAEVSAPLL